MTRLTENDERAACFSKSRSCEIRRNLATILEEVALSLALLDDCRPLRDPRSSAGLGCSCWVRSPRRSDKGSSPLFELIDERLETLGWLVR